MPKYLIQAKYVGDGIKGLLKEGGTSRRDTVRNAMESVGGKLESFYYAFGETDAFVVVEAPDNATAAAVLLNINSTGVVSCTTTVLMTPEEVDAATKISPNYRAPGK